MTRGSPHPRRRPDLRHPQIAGSAQPNPAAGTGSAGFASTRPSAPGQEARGKDWQILLELATGIARRGGLRARLHGMEAAFLRQLTPRRLIALAFRFGPYGARLHPFRKGLSLRELERAGPTIEFGPLQPGRLPRRLFTKGKRILLAPEPMLADLKRVDASFGAAPVAEELVLIGRRQLRGNNS